MKVTAASFSLEASRTISSQNRPEMQASFPSSSPSLSLSLRRPLQLSRVLDQRVERRLTKIGVKGCQSGLASWHPFFFFSCATSRPRKQRKGISPSPYGKTDSGNIARNNSNWCARAERDWPIFFNFEDLAKKDCKHVSSFYLIASGKEAHLVKSDTQVHKWSAYCVNTLPKRFSLYCQRTIILFPFSFSISVTHKYLHHKHWALPLFFLERRSRFNEVNRLFKWQLRLRITRMHLFNNLEETLIYIILKMLITSVKVTFHANM